MAQKRRVSGFFIIIILQVFDRSRWMRDRSIVRDPTTQDNTKTTPKYAYVIYVPSKIQAHDPNV